MYSNYKLRREESIEVCFKPQPKLSSFAEVLAQIDIYSRYLESLNSFKSEQVDNILIALLDIFDKWEWKRMAIAQRLADRNFASKLAGMTEYFLSVQEGFFTPDGLSTLLSYRNCVNVVWNYTDVSNTFVEAVMMTDLINSYLFNLIHQPFLDNRKFKQVYDIVVGSLAIMCNILTQCPEYKQIFIDKEACEKIEPFLKANDEVTKCLAITLMAKVISENEAHKLQDDGSIKFMIRHIDRALADRSHNVLGGTVGFQVIELLEGLELISVNDSNKKTIVDEGALGILVKAMQTNNAKEQDSAAKIIWTLCFDEYAKQKVIEEPDCVQVLENLCKSSHANVRKSAEGALWKLRGEKAHLSEQNTDNAHNAHIFISYDWDHSILARKISSTLKGDGHQVWIDTDQMGGSTLEAMSSAVENAKVVLICLSEKYKLSPNCRTEAEYTWVKRRPIVPLMMQRWYRPDGWLGAIIGAKFYVDFAKFEFEEAYQKLQKEMAVILKNAKSTDDVDGKVVISSSFPEVGALPPPSPKAAGRRKYEAAAWTKLQVHEWITSAELRGVLSDKLQILLESMDGKRLVAFCWVKNKVPKYFMKELTKKYDADMLQIVHLIDALNELP